MRWLLKQWWFWGGTGFIVVAIVAGYLFIPFSPSGINRTNYDKVQNGMTLAQVKNILGEHPMDLTAVLAGDRLRERTHVWVWFDDDGNLISVDLDTKLGITEEKQFRPTEFSFLELMKRRIKRRVQAFWP